MACPRCGGRTRTNVVPHPRGTSATVSVTACLSCAWSTSQTIEHKLSRVKPLSGQLTLDHKMIGSHGVIIDVPRARRAK